MIDPMKGKQTLKSAELQDGDIVCFQQPEKSPDVKSSESVRSSDSITLVELVCTLAVYM